MFHCMTMVRLLKTRLFSISLSLAIVSSTAQHLPRDGQDASQADKMDRKRELSTHIYSIISIPFSMRLLNSIEMTVSKVEI